MGRATCLCVKHVSTWGHSCYTWTLYNFAHVCLVCFYRDNCILFCVVRFELVEFGHWSFIAALSHVFHHEIRPTKPVYTLIQFLYNFFVVLRPKSSLVYWIIPLIILNVLNEWQVVLFYLFCVSRLQLLKYQGPNWQQ